MMYVTFFATYFNCGAKVIIRRTSVNFLFLESCVFREYASSIRNSILTASCFIVNFGNLRNSLHKDLDVVFLKKILRIFV